MSNLQLRGLKSMISRPMIKMLVIVGILFGGIFGFQAFKMYSIKKFMSAHKGPAVTVTATKVRAETWQTKLKTAASFSADNGVDLTTERAGVIKNILFSSGGYAQKDDILVELDAEADIALLQSRQAAAELAKITYQRDKAQFSAKAISKAVLDADAADLKSKTAQMDEQAVLVKKKTIRAPFAGRLGIMSINVGQYLNVGDIIISLQTLDPMNIKFNMPQQAVSQLSVGQLVQIRTDVYPDQVFEGKITAINPQVDDTTRNILVQAQLSNPQEMLLPGMFATVEVFAGNPKQYLAVPQEAISFNPYGEVAYILRESGQDAAGKPLLTAHQIFVTTGEKQDGKVAVLKGLKEGDLVVTAGQHKLKANSPVILNNSSLSKDNSVSTADHQ